MDITGSDQNDTLSGTEDADVIRGLKGDDLIQAAGGDDVAYGNEGRDQITGDAGNDTLFGGQDDDILRGGEGDDELHGNKGDNALFGGRGDDVLIGGDGINILTGGQGHDSFVFSAMQPQNDATTETVPSTVETTQITDFHATEDTIVIDGLSTANVVYGGTVSGGANDLEGVILDANVRTPNHVAFVDVADGALSGHRYVVYNVEGNYGTIELTTLAGQLTAANFHGTDNF